MTLYYPGNAQTSRCLDGRGVASIVQKELLSGLGTVNQGLYSRPQLAVLRTTTMPAVITEVGYITDKSELARLKTASYKQKSAASLEKAILRIFNIK